METTSIERNTTTAPQNQSPVSNKTVGSKKLLVYVGLSLLIIGVGLSVYYWQNSIVNDSKRDMSSLQAQKKTLTKDKQSLEARNKNLSESIDVLQGQLAYAATTSQVAQSKSNTDATVTAKPATKLTVSAVKNLPGAEFAKSGYTPPQGSFKVVYATITNQSSNEQSYEVNQFTAISKSGSVLKPQIFSPLETQGLWNDFKLVSGGTQDIALLFSQDQDIVVLTHTPEASTDPVSVSLPVVQR